MRKFRSPRRGFSLIELLIAVTILMILTTIAVVNMQRAQMGAREAAAIQAIHTIHKAQAQYQPVCGRYANTLAELGPPQSGATAGCGTADLIGDDLASGEMLGYKFSIKGDEAGYTVSAVPKAYGGTGTRTFFSNQRMAIRENRGPEPATAESALLK